MNIAGRPSGLCLSASVRNSAAETVSDTQPSQKTFDTSIPSASMKNNADTETLLVTFL